MVRSKTRLVGAGAEVVIGLDEPVVVISSATDPGAVSVDLSAAGQRAIAQVQAGAAVIEVRVDHGDENALLPALAEAVSKSVPVPLCISARDPRALDAALAKCPGKSVVYWVDQSSKTWSEFLAVASKWGAAVIVPGAEDHGSTTEGAEGSVEKAILSGAAANHRGLPATYEEQIETSRRLVRESILGGVNRHDVIMELVALPELQHPGATATALKLAAHLSQIDAINLAMHISDASAGMAQPEIFDTILLSRALSSGVTIVFADASVYRTAAVGADALMGRVGGVSSLA